MIVVQQARGALGEEFQWPTAQLNDYLAFGKSKRAAPCDAKSSQHHGNSALRAWQVMQSPEGNYENSERSKASRSTSQTFVGCNSCTEQLVAAGNSLLNKHYGLRWPETLRSLKERLWKPATMQLACASMTPCQNRSPGLHCLQQS